MGNCSSFIVPLTVKGKITEVFIHLTGSVWEWVAPKEHKGSYYGADILPPPTLGRMKEIGGKIAKDYKYVRVDFYDLDGKLYYGEITLHHGSGLDTFEPEKWDLEYGKKLKLQ